MNGNTLKSVVTKYGHLESSALADAVKSDDRQFNDDEIAEIISAIKTSKVSTEDSAAVKTVSPNDKIAHQLKQFDYENLTGEEWDKYSKLVASLSGHENFDFVQYMASGKFQKKQDENLHIYDALVGIVINNIKPLNTTRVPMKVARDLNAQIYNRENPPSNSRYFLLKKPS